MTGEAMWLAYCRAAGTDTEARHDIWKFCGGGAAADELAELVLAGTKTATSAAKLSYEAAGEALPEAGTHSVILFDNGAAACVLRDTKVSVVPFHRVGAEHAWKEGEGDRSLETWREIHRRAFTPDLRAAGQELEDDTPCVLEEFEVVYR